MVFDNASVYKLISLMIASCFLLVGCRSSLSVPHDSLQREAENKIRSTYNNLDSLLLTEAVYDQSIDAYNMKYDVLLETGRCISRKISIRARAFYNKQKKSWNEVLISKENEVCIPNLELMESQWYTVGIKGGYVNIKLLSADAERQVLYLDIEAKNMDNLTLSAANLACPYTTDTSDGKMFSWERARYIYADIGEYDGIRYTLEMKFLTPENFYNNGDGVMELVFRASNRFGTTSVNAMEVGQY